MNRVLLKKNVKYVDFHKSLCEDGFCSVYQPNTEELLYSDVRGHFSINNPSPLANEWFIFLKEHLDSKSN